MPVMNNNTSVCLVGLATSTSLGITAQSSVAAVRAGISAFAEHPYIVDKTGEPMIVARAPYLSDDSVGTERFLQLAMPAAKEALLPLRELVGRIKPIPVVIGLPAKRPGLPESLGNQMAVQFKGMMNELCPISSVDVIPSGHSAGLMALQAGWRRVQAGNAQFCVIGGVDSYLQPETLEWVDECEQLHSDSNAWGFVPGEAAGFCLLSSMQAADDYRLNILGKVLGVATAREHNLIKTKTVCIGQGLSEAFKWVLEGHLSSNAKIGQIICDMNGEPYRADEFAFTITRTSEYFINVGDFLAPADCWGDVGAASGPLFVTLAVIAGLKGYSKGPYTLVWTSSEGGERSAALIQTYN